LGDASATVGIIAASKFRKARVEEAMKPLLEVLLDTKKLTATCGEAALKGSSEFAELSKSLCAYSADILDAAQRCFLDVFSSASLNWVKQGLFHDDAGKSVQALEAIHDVSQYVQGCLEDLLMFAIPTEQEENVLVRENFDQAFFSVKSKSMKIMGQFLFGNRCWGSLGLLAGWGGVRAGLGAWVRVGLKQS